MYTELLDCEKMQLRYIPANLSEWADRHGNTKIMSKANSQNKDLIRWLFSHHALDSNRDAKALQSK